MPSFSLFDSMLVETKYINVRRNTTVFSNCWRNLLHVSALFWLGHHQVETGISEKTRFPNSWCPHCSIWVFSDILVSTWWWPNQKRAETCSCFIQQIGNTVVLRRTFIHLICTSIESHIGDDATKDRAIKSIGGYRSTSPCIPSLSSTFRGSNSFPIRFTLGLPGPQQGLGFCGRVLSLFFYLESNLCTLVIQTLTEAMLWKSRHGA
jgi:hypothetical protein